LFSLRQLFFGWTVSCVIGFLLSFHVSVEGAVSGSVDSASKRGNTITAQSLTNSPTVTALPLTTGAKPEPGTEGITVTATAQTTLLTPVIPAPKGLAGKAGGNKILLAWEPVQLGGNSKVAYHVFRSEAKLRTPLPGEPWPEPINFQPIFDEYFLDAPGSSRTPPVPERIYYYAVVAVDARGNTSLFSDSLQILNKPELSAPMGLEGRPGDQRVYLSWIPAFSGGEQGLAGYILFRSQQEGELGQPLFEKPITTDHFVDEGTEVERLINGTTYYYTLYAQDNAGLRSDPTEQIAVTPFLPAGMPKNLTATGKTDDMIELKWTASTAGTYPLKGYNIYRQSDLEEAPVKINKMLCTSTVYIDSEKNSISKPLLGRFYSYTVRPVDEKGWEGESSVVARSGPRIPLEIPKTGLLSTSIPGLPPESSLTISGRKKIDISYTEVLPLNTEPGGPQERYPSITSGLSKGFNLEQELQVRLEGKVGKKITVDVDYDDTKEEQRKISIIYAGDPDEVIQEAAFGDILLDLPRTEFAGYNKNLFGAKLKVALDKFRFTAIGAQTKGITVTEKFKGNTSPRVLDKQDINFTAFKYYYLTKDWPNQINHPELPNYDSTQSRHGIVPGSDKIYVANGTVTADTVTVNAYGQELKFNLYSPGVDYTIDYDRGIVTFTSSIQQTWLIAVAYRYYDVNGAEHSVGYNASGEFDFTAANLNVPADGRVSDTAHLIQSYDSTTNARDYRMMLMNRYSLGYQNILDPQSDPDFVIKIFYANEQEYTPQLPQPADTQNAEQYYRIDPTFGTIQFTHNYPFQQRSASEPAQFLSDEYHDDRNDAYNTLYNPNLTSGADSTNAHQFKIHVEFKNLITTFQLSHWNVIKNSEIIKKDGSKLQRNTDYYIDYDTGFITFLNPESIASSTEITVTYEYLPFGGKFQSNLFGVRAEYDLIDKKVSLGSTFLYNASQTPLDIPDIRSTPTSLSLIDGDIKFSLNPDDWGEWALPYIGNFKLPLTLDVTAEAAYSSYQVNTYRKAGEDGVAMIDSMEGSDNILSLPTDNNSWFPSSRPESFTDPDARKYIYQTDAFETGHLPVDSNDKSHQLRWYYTDLSSDTWDGFIYPISASGSNLHDYRNIEIWVYSAAASAYPVVLNIDIGIVSEDSNGNGRLNFEGDRQTLGTGDDVGIVNYMSNPYAVPPVIEKDPSGGPQGIYPTNAPAGYWGENNNRLNSEDMDGDDQLDQMESFYEYEYVLQPGWQLVKIPLSDYTRLGGSTYPTSNAQDANFMSFVKHVRIWITTQSSTPSSGYIQFESIQLTGNKWQPKGLDSSGNATIEPSSNTINATTISLENDSGYVPNTYFYIYDENQKEEELQNERALKLEYNLDSNATVSATNTMPAYYLTRSLSTTSTSYDYSGYRYLRVDVYKRVPNNPGERFFVRLGLDQNNFYHYEFNLDEAPVGAWHTFTAALDGSDGKRIDFFSSTILSGLSQIKEISMGVINPGPDLDSTPKELWINNLRVTGGETCVGMALRISSSTRLADIFTVTTDLRDVASDFYTIDESPRGKQHTTSSSVKGTITKISFLPINASWSRIANFTELKHRSDPSYSNNFSTPDVVTETLSGDVAYNQLPGLDISVSASRSRKATTYIDQLYNVNNFEETCKATPGISYSLPSRIFNLPIGSTTFTGKFAYTDTHTMYDPEGISKLNRTDLWDRWKHTKEETYTYQGSYSPIQYIRLTPSFTYSQVSDRGNLSWYRFYAALDTNQNPDNKHYFSDIYRMSKLNKIAKLNVSFLSLPVISPTISYSMTNTRDYINDTLSVPGSLSLQSGLAFGEVIGWTKFPKFNLSQSYTTSATYKNELGDDPIGKLDFEHLWLIDPIKFKEKDEKFDNAYINSKTLSESVSTSISLIQDVSLTPQYSNSWTRRMNSPDNFNTTTTLSIGSGLVWSRIPFFKWMTLQSLNLDCRYSENSTFDTNDREITRNTTYTSSLTLPFRVFDDISSTFKLGATNTVRLSGEGLGVKVYENTYTSGLSVSYNLHMDTPFHLPNFWPFNGAILKMQQTLRFTNSFNVEFVRNAEENISGNTKSTDTFTNDTTINYSLWKNVEGDLIITNQWFFDRVNANKDYWAIRIKAGLTAIF